MSTDITTTAHTIAEELGIDPHAALGAAREFLAQCRALDGIDHDEDDLDEATADFVAESIRRSVDQWSATPLQAVEEASLALATAEDGARMAREGRDRAIIAARHAGVRATDIAQAAGISHQAISLIMGAARS